MRRPETARSGHRAFPIQVPRIGVIPTFTVSKTRWVPGRRIFLNAIATSIFRRRHPGELQRGMRRPSDRGILNLNRDIDLGL